MGEGEIIEKLRKSHVSNKREFTFLATVYQVKMQTAICKNHPISYSNEENKTEKNVSDILECI